MLVLDYFLARMIVPARQLPARALRWHADPARLPIHATQWQAGSSEEDRKDGRTRKKSLSTIEMFINYANSNGGRPR